MSAKSSETGRRGRFTDTRWSVVVAAMQHDSPAATEALEKLCRIYWAPLYAFIRQEGHAEADAKDLTQAFFEHLLEQKFLEHLKHRQGKFRSFLLKFLKHFLSDQRDKARAQKRGGRQQFIALDEFETEERNRLGPIDGLTPDQVFERRWAQALLDRVLQRLRDEYSAKGKVGLFEQLKDLQPGTHGSDNYAAIGQRLGLAQGSIKSAVHRLRQRHRELLLEEIALTVMRPEEIADEVRHLLAVVGR